jgi:hypothetical protein
MMNRNNRNRGKISLFVLVLGLCALLSSSGYADDKADMAGWEKDSPYNANYVVSEFDNFKGVVEEIVDITPTPGMAAGIGLVVRDQDGDKVNVHVGPKSFVKVDSIGLKKGDKVKIKGVWADIDGQEVFIASKIKKGEDVELKVRRTKDGVPYWTMSPEDLAKEKGEE